MNTDKLNRVRAACLRVLELDEKATPGPWKSVDNEGLDTFVMAGNEAVCRTSVPFYCERGDASFIALSRNLSPALARAMLLALSALLDEADQTCRGTPNFCSCSYHTLLSILNCFPDDV